MMDTKELQQEIDLQYKKKQQEIIDSFYAEYVNWNSEAMGQKMVVLLMELARGICLCIPYQMFWQLDKSFAGLLAFMGIFSVTSYIRPYLLYKEDQKMTRIYEKIKYLPISLKQLRVFRLKKIAGFYLKVFLIIFVAHILFALISYHEICWGNIWYPTVFGLLVPLVFGLILYGAK